MPGATIACYRILQVVVFMLALPLVPIVGIACGLGWIFEKLGDAADGPLVL